MAVKNITSGIVHKGYKGGTTGCGFSTTVDKDDWRNVFQQITCNKDGCKN